MTFVFAVDGFGPVNGWPVFVACILFILVVGGGLGAIGRAADMRKQRGERS